MPSKNSVSPRVNSYNREAKESFLNFPVPPPEPEGFSQTQSVLHAIFAFQFLRGFGHVVGIESLVMQKLADMGNEKNEVALYPDQQRSDEKD